LWIFGSGVQVFLGSPACIVTVSEVIVTEFHIKFDLEGYGFETSDTKISGSPLNSKKETNKRNMNNTL
jgi:hypothetical protein